MNFVLSRGILRDMQRIGLLIERHWHYGRRLCEGIASRARELGGMSLEFIDWETPAAGRGLRGFAGFIARVWSADIARRLKATGRPVVDVYGGVAETPFVVADQNADLVGRLAAEHFLDRRFERFAFCGYSCQRYSVLRRKAYARALREAGFECDVFEDASFTAEKFGRKVIGRGDYDAGLAARPLAAWLKSLEKPVAVFCAHDLVALQVAETCRKAGLGIPREVAVLGVDDDPLLCDFREPTISSIDPNPFEIGREAVDALAEWLANPGRRPADRRPAPAGLVGRASTQTCPAPEPWLSDALCYIRENIGRNINASEVIAALRRSHTTVEAAFREKLGTTVRREIARVRIEEAKTLLRDAALPLAEVCKRAGFSSKAYFTAAFRAATGLAPGAWRESAGSSRRRQLREASGRIGVEVRD